ncbi:MAG: uroporphyrinogen-III C-methyltransferase [Gammaproteobacteria bacterium]
MGEENIGIASSSELHAAPEKVVKNKKEKSNLYGVLILLAVLLIAAAGFIFLQELRTRQEGLGGALDKGDRRLATLSEQFSTLQSQMGTLQSQMATLQNSLETRESKFERELSDFKEHHSSQLASTKSELYDAIAKIQNLLNRTRGDWMIADAEYLLSVANHRLNLVGDVKTSLIALQAADERLRDSGNPGVFKVREQLAREIDSLKSLKPVDIVGLFSRIRILEEQVANLPVFFPHAGAVQQKLESTPSKEATKPEEISGVGEILDSAIEDLKGLVVVRRSDREIDVVLQPEEVRLLREQLKIKLEMTRLALLERDSELFRRNIEEIKSSLGTYFRTEAPETKKFAAELEDLQAVAVDINYPDISGSLKLLQHLAALRVEIDRSEGARPAPPPVKTQAPGPAKAAVVPDQEGPPEGAQP